MTLINDTLKRYFHNCPSLHSLLIPSWLSPTERVFFPFLPLKPDHDAPFCESLQIIVWFEIRVSRVLHRNYRAWQPRTYASSAGIEFSSLLFSSLFALWLQQGLMGFLHQRPKSFFSALMSRLIISQITLSSRIISENLFCSSAWPGKIVFVSNTCKCNAPVKP